MGKEWAERGTYIPMDTTSLYYFQELAKDLHMTRTAERLYISQQTLSNHILRLEKQLGCQLFNRRPSLSLTYAGEQVLAFAEQTIRSQVNLQDILADVESQKRGSIRFGASTLRMNACLPVILPCFSSEYPYVQIQITDQTSRRLEPMILNGELDFALVAETGKPDPASNPDKGKKKGGSAFGKDSSLIREPLIHDPVFLCVTDEILRQHLGEKASEVIHLSQHGANLLHFRDVPFMLFQNRMGALIEQCFEEAGVEPQIYITAPYTQIITRIGLEGTAAFFSTGVILSSLAEGIPSNLHVFPLLYQGIPLYHDIYLVRASDRYVPKYAGRFLELLKECFHNIENFPVEENLLSEDLQ